LRKLFYYPLHRPGKQKEPNREAAGIIFSVISSELHPAVTKPKQFSMQKTNVSTSTAMGKDRISVGMPSVPDTGKSITIERKISDPSSCLPKGERYPIPSFFEYRISPRDYDPL
jgi:hypothetical protein